MDDKNGEGFLWTARLFQGTEPVAARYFSSRQERDQFVLNHPEWKKRGKICAGNLEKHTDQIQTK